MRIAVISVRWSPHGSQLTPTFLNATVAARPKDCENDKNTIKNCGIEVTFSDY